MPPRPDLSAVIASLQHAWRRSLQLRVVTTTLGFAGALVLTFGLVVGASITDGLINAKTSAARQTVDDSSQYARDRLRGKISGANDPLADWSLKAIIADLEYRDRPAGLTRVAILPDGEQSQSLRTPAGQPTIPEDFRKAVREDGFVSARYRLSPDGSPQRLHLLFGRQVELTWGEVQIFYFFPLDDVVSQVNLVGRTLAATGATLVALVVLLVYLVTRMVVKPVRAAARTAQRLSNGLLDQRMDVVGEDDLAALAASFNQMAGNLQRHILRLEEMSRLQRRFTSDVSHELRTPLTTVRMAADLIYNSRDEFDPAVARSAELLVAELDRFEALLTELLEISRFDAGFANLDAEPASLGPLVQRVAERFSVLARRNGVDLIVDVPDDPVVAEVDIRRVERILRNLIGNAIEHGEGRPVKIRLAAREGSVAITVRDYGVGLKPGEEKLVFNRFWRADASRARQTGGTGLGLSISSEDARLHGGWLEAWGEPGRGAQFRLTLPCRAGDRLTTSPLSLIPADFRTPVPPASTPAPTDPPVPAQATAPDESPASAEGAVPAETAAPAEGTTATETAAVAAGGAAARGRPEPMAGSASAKRPRPARTPARTKPTGSDSV